MKVVADQNIPCVADAFADLGEVVTLPGREIRPHHLRDCQCLVTRSVTRVDAALLADSPVEFVGSATIGFDHIDRDYLQSAGITFTNAAGCNAEAAAEYVLAGLFALSARLDFDPFRLTAGIVGVGNVGRRLQHKLETLGIDCHLCDPPRQAAEPDETFHELEQILDSCDFISLHVPLTEAGEHPTHHLLDAERLQRLRPGCVLVNAARGEVIDNAALLDLLERRDDLRVFLDTWENEPRPLRALLRRVDLATPHIAGYSVEGRLRATQMIRDAAGAHFGVPGCWDMGDEIPAMIELDLRECGNGLPFWQSLLTRHCRVERDHHALLEALDLDAESLGRHFDSLRRVYPDRLEYDRCRLRIDHAQQPVAQLESLGFRII